MSGPTQVVPGTGSWRPLASLGLAIVAWLPSARALLAGDLDMTVAAVRFLVAVGVAWVGLGLVAMVLRGYLAGAAGKVAAVSGIDDADEIADVEVVEPLRRRRSDNGEATAAPAGPVIDVASSEEPV